MQYSGGKEQIAGRLVPELLRYKNGHTTYIEPFMGGGSIFARMAPNFEKAIGADVVPDLIMLWQALQDGWEPPDALSETEYHQLRFAPPSALRAFAGFGCSFGGKWFGGYAQSKARDRNFAAVAKESLRVKASGMGRAKFLAIDYRTLNQVSERCLIYCDPPYTGTTGYKAGSRHFDTAALWNKVYSWRDQGAVVLVSEYWAPEGVPCVWSSSKHLTLSLDKSKHSTENLYAVIP